MTVSNVSLIIGIWLVMTGWERVYKSQGKLLTEGVYKYVRHPQYTGIFIVIVGFVIQWPTLTTLILWPFVVAMYVRLAKQEEQDVLQEFPQEYRESMQRTPMCFSRLLPQRTAQPGEMISVPQ